MTPLAPEIDRLAILAEKCGLTMWVEEESLDFTRPFGGDYGTRILKRDGLKGIERTIACGVEFVWEF